MASRVLHVSSFVLSDVFGSVLRFPLWWYTEGLHSLARWCGRTIIYQARGYSIGLWVRHFFTPMYGTRDWASRLISVMMRAVIIVARSIALLVETAVLCALLIAWCVAPIVFVVFLILNVSIGLESWSRPV